MFFVISAACTGVKDGSVSFSAASGGNPALHLIEVLKQILRNSHNQ
jgi:hypothetical protein